MRIALFITCLNDALFPRAGKALVRILETLGHDVEFPPTQTCCGQIHFNTGYRTEARQLMNGWLSSFRTADVVVAPSASCVAMVREQYPVLAEEVGDADLISQVRSLAARTFEMSEFLVGELGVEDVGGSFPGRVALHTPCHSIRGINVGSGPEKLLRATRGLELVDLPRGRECCGFGGTFSVKNPDTSLAMLSDKIQAVQESGAQVLTAVDNSCLMHIAGGLRREGLLWEGASVLPPDGTIRVLHLAEILACGEGSGPEIEEKGMGRGGGP